MSLPTDATFRALVSILAEVNSNMELLLKLQCMDHGVTIEDLRNFNPEDTEEAVAEIQTEDDLDRQTAMREAALASGYEVNEDTDFDDKSWLEERGEVAAQASTSVRGPGYGG